MSGTDKTTRILILLYRLTRGEHINKSAFAAEHDIDERSFYRDVNDIRNLLSEMYSKNELVFSEELNAYYLTNYSKIDVLGVEILALLKILLSTRVFRKDEMSGLISVISDLIPLDKKKQIMNLLQSEMDSYVSPNHNKALLKLQWDLGQCILKKRIIELNYSKHNGEKVKRRVLPISILFSEHYFYLLAFRDGEEYDYPAFFRLDRIESFVLTKEKYPLKLFEQYNVGTMKQCIQFMYAGELSDVKLKCSEDAFEAILDKLPNAKVIERGEEESIVTAKIFHDGFIRWILSQGSAVEILEPEELREKVKLQANKILGLYTKGEDVANVQKNQIPLGNGK